MTISILALSLAAVIAVSPRPSISYEISVDSARTDAIGVTIHLRNAPPRVQLAMKVHPEYDAPTRRCGKPRFQTAPPTFATPFGSRATRPARDERGNVSCAATAR